MRDFFYRVAEHTFCISFADPDNDETLIPSFARFQVEKAEQEDLLFHMIVDDSFAWDTLGHEIGQFDCGGCNHGVYRTENGEYQFMISDIIGTLCSSMQATPQFSESHVALHGNSWNQRNYGLNNAIMMTYAFAAADKQTMLMHASVIRCEGKGFLMTAPSGTGKSTHTRLWYDNIPGCDLMNDDNPVVRIKDGEAVVYGSPWSGKTPCYRNIQAPIGGLVRIQQKPQNSIRHLGTIEAFTHLLPAMSSMKWDKRVYNGVCDGITSLIRLCGMYELGCLPNAEAAHLCHDTLMGSQQT